MVDSLALSTVKLVQVVPNLKRPQKFLLDRFFPNIVEADTEEVAIDVQVGIRRMAPFVSPLVEGKLVESVGMKTNRFRPAYIKDKRAPDLRRPVRRSIGEKIGGDLEPGEREMINLQYEMEDQIDMIDRRLEWMAASALTTGTVVVAGEGYDTALVDFGRDSRLSIALTGSDRWGQGLTGPNGTDPKVSTNITDWQALVLRLSGAVTKDLVFTNKAWGLFLNGTGVQAAIQYPALANSGNNINPAAAVQHGAVYMGEWAGKTLWLYNDWYVDDNGYELPMLPDGYVLLAGPDMLGTRAFGLIVDPKFNYQPMAYAPKTWLVEDPAQRLLMMQSAPLVIPSRVNAALAVKVA